MIWINVCGSTTPSLIKSIENIDRIVAARNIDLVEILRTPETTKNLCIFQAGTFLEDQNELINAFTFRGLEPASFADLVNLNRVFPRLTDLASIATCWLHDVDVWRYGALFTLRNSKTLLVSEYPEGWSCAWWFIGIRA